MADQITFPFTRNNIQLSYKKFNTLKERTSITISANYTLITFDVASLDTNVPIPQFLEFRTKLTNINLAIPINNLILLLELCLKQNVFSFDNKFYKHIIATGMGSSFSPTVANIYFELYELQLLKNIPLFPSIFSGLDT